MERVKESDKIALSCANVWLGDDGILQLRYHPGAEITIMEAKMVGEAIIHASKGSKHPLYADMRGLKSMSREARVYFASEELTKWTSAVATRDSLISKVIVEFYLKLNKPPYPMKYFSSEDKAIKWLKEFVE